MKLVFFGTPYYVLPILEAVHKSFRERGESPIKAVVTQSPKPSGRKQILEYSAVDKWAHSKKIPIYFDSNKLIVDQVKADVAVLASYGDKIPPEVIKHFPHGILVVHPSLLPEFRWGSPVPAAIVTNSNPTGVTIIKMDDKWDHGPIVTQFKEEIFDDDNYQTLRDRLFAKSAGVLVQAFPAYLTAKIKLKPQDDNKASFARMIKKEDAFIPPKFIASALKGEVFRGKKWTIDFIEVGNKPFTFHPSPFTLNKFILAMTPWPGAWTEVSLGQSAKDKVQRRMKILKAHVNGSIINNQRLIIDLIQLEGKNPVTWEEFKRGYPEATFS